MVHKILLVKSVECALFVVQIAWKEQCRIVQSAQNCVKYWKVDKTGIFLNYSKSISLNIYCTFLTSAVLYL